LLFSRSTFSLFPVHTGFYYLSFLRTPPSPGRQRPVAKARSSISSTNANIALRFSLVHGGEVQYSDPHLRSSPSRRGGCLLLDPRLLHVRGRPELRDLYVPCDPPDVVASSHATQQLKGDSSLELLGLNRHLPETSRGAISH
jgi:hypothetical protein